LPLYLSLYTPRARMNPRTRERKDWWRDWRRKEGRRRKHQHHSMDTINILNLVHGELKRSSSHFLDFLPKN